MQASAGFTFASVELATGRITCTCFGPSCSRGAVRCRERLQIDLTSSYSCFGDCLRSSLGSASEVAFDLETTFICRSNQNNLNLLYITEN